MVGLLFLTIIWSLSTAHAQEVNLDKTKTVDGLTCYQSFKDPNIWYYLPDQPRLATKNGKPQFSFMKYSRTNKQGKAGTNAAQGGGILHFLVTYGVSKDRVRNAERQLQEDYPEARIDGPIIYRRGSFALTTSFTKDQVHLVRTVAIGKAPLMEGQKTAVSMALSREGAEVLWESFKTDTPDITMVFDMEFAGVREPYMAKIEADWSRISKHKRLKAGFKYSWFGADVDMLFQELRQNGAIKITTKGQNANMDKIVQSAHAKLLQVMFDPAPVDELSKMAAEKDSYSNLNKAIDMIKSTKGTRRRGSTRRSSLNLKSPGFRQMMAFVINAALPHAHAAELIVSPQGLTEKYAEPLTNDQLAELMASYNTAKQLEKQNDLKGAVVFYRRYLNQYKSMTGTTLPAPSLRYKIGRLLYSDYETDNALEWFKCCCHTQECLNFQHQIEKEMAGSQTTPKTQGNKTAQKPARTQKTSSSSKKKSPGTDTAPKLPPLPDEQDSQSPDKEEVKNDEQSPKLDSDFELHMADNAADAYNRARKLDNEAVKSGYDPDKTLEAIDAYEHYLSLYAPTGSRKKEVEGRIRSLNRRLALENQKKEKPLADIDVTENQVKNTETPPKTSPSTVKKPSGGTPPKTTQRKTSPTSGAKPKTAGKPAKSQGKKPSAASSAARTAAKNTPGFSLVASFRLKNIKRSGKMVYEMNHYRTEKQSFPMAENIGGLYSRYHSDSRVFRAVTIDDPVFKQREIMVTLDGQDTATFTKYMNFVTVKMKKTHQSGDISTDEVVITPESFNKSANAFSLNYGYKSDTDREQWLTYEYQVVWSFHGGLEIRSDWKEGSSPMLSLNPPYRYKGLTIEGEGDALQQAGVRHAVVTVNSTIQGKPIATQATIKNLGPAPALHLEVPQGNADDQVQVGIKWFLKGGKTLESPVQNLDGDILYWDELP